MTVFIPFFFIALQNHARSRLYQPVQHYYVASHYLSGAEPQCHPANVVQTGFHGLVRGWDIAPSHYLRGWYWDVFWSPSAPLCTQILLPSHAVTDKSVTDDISPCRFTYLVRITVKKINVIQQSAQILLPDFDGGYKVHSFHEDPPLLFTTRKTTGTGWNPCNRRITPPESFFTNRLNDINTAQLFLGHRH